MREIPVKKIAFVDLDDTLIQSLRKCPPDEDISRCNVDPHLPPEKGAYTTPKQRALINLLASNFEVIPTTARNTKAFKALALPFQGTAILNHGATILTEAGTLDQAWHEHIGAILEATNSEARLRELYQRISAACDQLFPTVRVRLIEDHGISLYVVAKDTEGRAENLHSLHDSVVPTLQGNFPDFYIHHNDNNLAFIPAQISKQAAVEHLLARMRMNWTGKVLTIGMGDSLSDLPFMSQCDYLLIPGNSQIHRKTQEVCHAL